MDIEDVVKEDVEAKKSYKEFNFKDFSNLDQSTDADYLIDSMEELYEITGIKAMKKRAIARLNVKEGDKVIELGCGLGDDAETFGERIGDTGSVIAIDSSYRMLERAKARSTHSNVQYLQANASDLEFPDATFDICHADRLLVSQMEPRRVIAEGIRVLKEGGKLSITDCDFGSIVYYPYDEKVVPTLIKRMQAITQNPFIGRELHVLFKEQGLINISVEPEPYIVRSFEKLNTMINVPRIFNDLVYQGLITSQEANRQLNAFYKADEAGNFFYGITFYSAIGHKQL